MNKVKGVWPPMITPFTADGEVDYEAFIYNVKKWADTELEGRSQHWLLELVWKFYGKVAKQMLRVLTKVDKNNKIVVKA